VAVVAALSVGFLGASGPHVAVRAQGADSPTASPSTSATPGPERGDTVVHIEVTDASLEPIAGAEVTVLHGEKSASGVTDAAGVAEFDVGDILEFVELGPDGLQRFDILVEADGFGATTILNENFGPGGSIGVSLVESSRTIDRICTPRAASVFYPQCPDYQGTPGPPGTGSGTARGDEKTKPDIRLAAIAVAVATVAGALVTARLVRGLRRQQSGLHH
jgi:hypothetical protein